MFHHGEFISYFAFYLVQALFLCWLVHSLITEAVKNINLQAPQGQSEIEEIEAELVTDLAYTGSAKTLARQDILRISFYPDGCSDHNHNYCPTFARAEWDNSLGILRSSD